MEPDHIAIRTGLVGGDGFLLPFFLSLDAEVGIFESQALFVGNQGPDFFLSQELPGGHDGFRPDISGVGEMGQVPVVRVFASFLREVRAGPLGPEQVGLVLHVIAG